MMRLVLLCSTVALAGAAASAFAGSTANPQYSTVPPRLLVSVGGASVVADLGRWCVPRLRQCFHFDDFSRPCRPTAPPPVQGQLPPVAVAPCGPPAVRPGAAIGLGTRRAARRVR